MSFTESKKKEIILYLLEKIGRNESSVVQQTSQSFHVTPASIYKYLDKLISDGIVDKQKRGSYSLVKQTRYCSVNLNTPQFHSEERIYAEFIEPELSTLPSNVVRIWDYLCSEMLNNVIDHSMGDKLEITIEQDYLKTTVQLADNGIGIFEKIRAFFGLASAEEAVGELFKGKLTTDAQHHSGEGIFFSSRLADDFLIISSGLVFSHSRFSSDSLLKDASKAGTIVRMSLSNRSKKEAKDIFDQYAGVDRGFTRTQIPLTHYFDTAPVSRSHAKRLCSRLDRFQEVELDFSGLDWIGQGFAHQLFVVFQNEHPGIKLIPTGMSQDVENMYRHVMNKPI